MEDVVMSAAVNFWRDKRVLLTGHTGFKGAWLALMLHRLGAHITGISLPPTAVPNLFDMVRIADVSDSHLCDIRDATAIDSLVRKSQPEVIFHLAAQALVRVSYADPLTTFGTNVQGTANLLDAVRHLNCVRVVIAVTTDKVYKSQEQRYPSRETDPLGGHDPYSASKAAAEIIIASYRDSYLAAKKVAVASARAGNVIGGGDWSEDRLIPDAVRAWSTNQSLEIRRPQAVRPWQHVLEPLSGYMKLAEQLWQHPGLAGAYNFGPETSEAATVREVVQLAQFDYGRGEVSWGDGTNGPHEAGWLALEVAKARTVLGIKPRWSLREAVSQTMSWYCLQHEGSDARTLCEADIAKYESANESGQTV